NARVGRAEALGKLGRDEAARQTLAAVADVDPSHAGTALLRLGQLQERDGDMTSAEATYSTMALLVPDRTAEALFHVGFTRYVRRDLAGALAAWQQGLASGPPAPLWQAQLLYWSAKAMAPESTGAHDALAAAAKAAPESYYGLRAQEALNT